MAPEYDLFLSHNSEDKPAVREVAARLKRRRFKPWLDVENLIPGRLWQDEAEEVIRTCRAAAVFVGQKGIGPWEHQEIRALLNQAVKRDLPVIPVLLPGAPLTRPDLPLFLGERIWVDLRGGITQEGLDAIIWGVTGKKPGHRSSKSRPVVPAAPLPPVDASAAPPPLPAPERHVLLQLLDKVKGRLPRDVVAGSAPATRIELQLKESPNAVSQTPGVHSGYEILDLFQARERSLLILGEPGAGKTFTLQLLARGLADRAQPQQDPQGLEPIPVLLDLASWAEHPKLEDWLIWAIWDAFKLKPSTVRPWVEAESPKILPLLDGLHEVQPDCRADCVKKINDYLRDNGFYGMAVCCQSNIYKKLQELLPLTLMATVEVQPLTDNQIESYAAAAGPAGDGLREALEGDEDLKRLSRQPEFLRILEDVCQEGSGTTSLAESAGAPPKERRRRVFEIYANQKLERPHHYSRERTLRALVWLAQRMKKHNSTLFHLGQLQPTWLQASGERRAYYLLSRGFAGALLLLPAALFFRSAWMLLLGFVAGAVVGLFDSRLRLRQGLRRAFLHGLVTWPLLWLGFTQADLPGALYGTICAVMFGLVLGLRPAERGIGLDIEVAEELTWQRGSLGGALRGATAGAVLGLVLCFAVVLSGQDVDVRSALLAAGTLALTSAGIGGILGGVRGRPITEESRPDEELRSALKSAGLLFLLISSVLFLGLEAAILGVDQAWPGMGASVPPWLRPWFLGPLLGLAIGLRYSGLDLLQHFVLRALLTRRGFTPWRYVHFLDHAAVRGLLKKVGGGYRFYEQPLLEHFAAQPLDLGTMRK